MSATQGSHPELSLDDVRQMLAYIPAIDREEWLKVGMAIHAEFDDSGFAVWDHWSQSADNYRAADALAVWRSFKPGGVGIGSLVHLAKRHGWTPESASRPLPPLPAHKPPSKPPNLSTATYAKELWLAADCSDSLVGIHPYAVNKGIGWAAGAGRGIASGRVIGKQADCVIVPIRSIETGKVQAVQCINSKGQKQTFGPVNGGCLLLGNTLNKKLPWYVCEGWASAVSMVFHHHKGNAVCAASFGKGQLEKVAYALADVHAPDEILILVEDDR